jgi:hypothetical protein
MGVLLGGIGIAHTPTMGHAFDGLSPVKQWIADQAPTHVVVIYNNHLN